MKKGRTVLQAKRYGISTCDEDTSLLAVAQRMTAEEVGALAVVDKDGYLKGIITRTDLLRAHLEHDDWTTQRTGDCMTHDVLTVKTDALLYDVAHLLLDNHVHRIIVVLNENGKERPVAVISSSDMLYHMIRDV
ncbi:MAG: CBS domain-containing protein [Anaerolineae bacterium]